MRQLALEWPCSNRPVIQDIIDVNEAVQSKFIKAYPALRIKMCFYNHALRVVSAASFTDADKGNSQTHGPSRQLSKPGIVDCRVALQPSVKRVRSGPLTAQTRWRGDPSYSTEHERHHGSCVRGETLCGVPLHVGILQAMFACQELLWLKLLAIQLRTSTCSLRLRFSPRLCGSPRLCPADQSCSRRKSVWSSLACALLPVSLA